jgi:hypothetical protein
VKTYIYYLAYNHPQGSGACQVALGAPIEDITQINAITAQLLDSAPQLRQITVLSFQLLRTEES